MTATTQAADLIGRGLGDTGTIDPDGYGHGFTGTLYDRNRPVKQDAALIRKALRAATREPGNPIEGYKVSVRYRTASMMQAVDIELTPPEGAHVGHTFPRSYPIDHNAKCDGCNVPRWKALEELRDAGSHTGTPEWDRLPTVAADAAADYANRIHAAFNEDDSDMMTDYFHVKFYGRATVKGA